MSRASGYDYHQKSKGTCLFIHYQMSRAIDYTYYQTSGGTRWFIRRQRLLVTSIIRPKKNLFIYYQMARATGHDYHQKPRATGSFIIRCQGLLVMMIIIRQEALVCSLSDAKSYWLWSSSDIKRHLCIHHQTSTATGYDHYQSSRGTGLFITRCQGPLVMIIIIRQEVLVDSSLDVKGH